METCDLNHKLIVYDTRNCPLCSALELIEELKDGLTNLEKELENLKEEGKDGRRTE